MCHNHFEQIATVKHWIELATGKTNLENDDNTTRSKG